MFKRLGQRRWVRGNQLLLVRRHRARVSVRRKVRVHFILLMKMIWKLMMREKGKGKWNGLGKVSQLLVMIRVGLREDDSDSIVTMLKRVRVKMMIFCLKKMLMKELIMKTLLVTLEREVKVVKRVMVCCVMMMEILMRVKILMERKLSLTIPFSTLK